MSVQAEHSHTEATPLEPDSLSTANIVMLTAGGGLCPQDPSLLYSQVSMVFEFMMEKVLITDVLYNYKIWNCENPSLKEYFLMPLMCKVPC